MHRINIHGPASFTVIQHKTLVFISKMKTIVALSALTAVSQAQSTFVPVHGCEWVPETTPLTNFTLFHGPSDNGTPAYVQWNAPDLRVACYSFSSTTSIGKLGTSETVPCTAANSDGSNGWLQVSADAGSATLNFVFYAQCAADIFAFHYEATVELSCAVYAKESTRCLSKGNATASVTAEEYL